MVSVGVSAPFSLEKQRVERGISPSKAYQLGIRLCLDGGMDALTEKLKSVPELERTLAIKDAKIAALNNKIVLMKEELTFVQNKIAKEGG